MRPKIITDDHNTSLPLWDVLLRSCYKLSKENYSLFPVWIYLITSSLHSRRVVTSTLKSWFLFLFSNFLSTRCVRGLMPLSYDCKKKKYPMSRSSYYGGADRLQGTQVDGLDLECMRGTSAILTEEKERSKSVDEGDSCIFSFIMSSLNHFPDRCQHPAARLGRSLSSQSPPR